jgi:hypothetical protein
MRSLVKPFIAAVFFLVFLTVSPVQADSLVVTGGSVSASRSTGTLQGINFIFQGQGFSIQGIADVFTSPNPATLGDLGPGTTLSLNSVLSDFPGGSVFSAVVNGTTYNGSELGSISGSIFLTSGSFVLPVDGTPSLTLTDSFQMSGLLFVYSKEDSANPVLSTQLSGMGQVSLDLVLQSNGLYSVRGFTYEFQQNAPVPEPATLLLLGSGLAGLAVRARRRKTKDAA